MNKRALALILFIVAVIAIAYAIYRSPSETITIIEGAKQTVYGDPQHGLTTGLGVFAGLCVLGAVLLLNNDNRNLVNDQRIVSKKAADRLATNYPSS